MVLSTAGKPLEEPILLGVLEGILESLESSFVVILIQPCLLKLGIGEHPVCMTNELDCITKDGAGFTHAASEGKFHRDSDLRVSIEVQEQWKRSSQITSDFQVAEPS